MTRLLAVDPGIVHNGLSLWEFGDSERPDCVWAEEVNTVARLYTLFEQIVPTLDYAVVEEFRLYPGKAREQGYSQFETCERIGVLDYLTSRADVPLSRQGASLKKPARKLAAAKGFPMTERVIGSGAKKYRGADFQHKSGHVRDSMAHAVWWIYRSKDNPLNSAG